MNSVPALCTWSGSASTRPPKNRRSRSNGEIRGTRRSDISFQSSISISCNVNMNSQASSALRARARCAAAAPAQGGTFPRGQLFDAPVRPRHRRASRSERGAVVLRSAASDTANTTTTATAAPPPAADLWASFAAAVSGEWDGITVTFDRDGEPQELPEYYVPQVSKRGLANVPPAPPAVSGALQRLLTARVSLCCSYRSTRRTATGRSRSTTGSRSAACWPTPRACGARCGG